jgi:hypothetical protein
MKKWYKVKEGVEYSTDLNFFMQHQVAYVINRSSYPELRIFSRLDGKLFHQEKNVFLTQQNSTIKNWEDSALQKIKDVHKRLLAGEFYN